MKHDRHLVIIATSVVVGLLGGGAVVIARSRMVPVAPPMTEPDPRVTEAAAAQLLIDFKKADWDLAKMDLSRFRIPQQELAESPQKRKRPSNTFYPGQRKYYGNTDLAFYSTLHVKQNMRPGSGPEGRIASPSGKFLVAWKTGHIEWLDLNEVRMKEDATKPGDYYYVFPGMKEYSTSLPKFGFMK
jgi:hypothetical protein